MNSYHTADTVPATEQSIETPLSLGLIKTMVEGPSSRVAPAATQEPLV